MNQNTEKKLSEVIEQMIQQGEYEKAAETFISRTNTKISITYLKYGTMPLWKDKTPRAIYTISLTRAGKGKYKTKFGQSIHASSRGERPSAYDFLSCLNKHPDNFEDFCSMFDYDTDSRSAEKIWKACMKEYKGLEKLYTPEELDVFREIN